MLIRIKSEDIMEGKKVAKILRNVQGQVK